MSAYINTGPRSAMLSPVPAAETLGSAAKASKSDGKIEKAAKDFEAILLGSWFQSAEETFAKVPGSEEEDEDGGGSQFMGMAMQSLGTSLAAGGGIGIAKMISEQLHKTTGVQNKTTDRTSPEPTQGLPVQAGRVPGAFD